MNDDSCAVKCTEIVPCDKFEDCSDVTDVKCESLFTQKVGVTSNFYFIYLVYVHICGAFYLLNFNLFIKQSE